jgi:hypothetical protein
MLSKIHREEYHCNAASQPDKYKAFTVVTFIWEKCPG